ncbi:GNAT family N-acetyltransferase [Listeria costaricensis]|uniref:GNAT family N-acetyltransferase n=1 Tax=Listeria costaricensis TaxID=2026604 RepID=UPI000C082D3C|nr:GNAT family N-acetyltransferase [Listeria costaricensis]
MGEIREALAEDFPKLRDIFAESRRQHFFWLEERQIVLEDFDRLTHDERIWLYQDENGEPIGFISVYEPENFIHLLFIANDWQGHGIATQLLQFLVAKGPVDYTLKCVAKNETALTFYQKMNFKVIGEGMDPLEGKYYELFLKGRGES